jgi:LPS-assembly lipoprotein
MKKSLRNLFIVLSLMFVVTGCGFHLRGAGFADLDMPVTTIQNLDASNQFAAELRRALRSSGTEIVDDSAAAQVILTLSNEQHSRRVLSVGATGKVQEYELFYSITFTAGDRDGNVLLPAQVIKRVRSYAFDETDVLAKQSEENLLYRDMRRDAIVEILRRLQELRR